MFCQGYMSTSVAFLVRFWQLCSDTAAMTWKAKAVTAYTVYAVNMNFPRRCCSSVIHSRHAVVWFLPGCCAESLEYSAGYDISLVHSFTYGSTVEEHSFDLLTSNISRRIPVIKMLRKAQNMPLEPWSCCTLSGFFTKGCWGKSSNRDFSYCNIFYFLGISS